MSRVAAALRRHGWTGRALALTLLLGVLGGAIAVAWDVLRPSLAPFGFTGLQTLLDGLLALPALLPAAFVPVPGAVVVGLLVGQLVRLTGGTLPVSIWTLLPVPIVAALPELWLALRRRGTGSQTVTLTVAGALVGAGSVAAARLLSPGAYAADAWLGVLGGSIVSASAAGYLVARAARWLGSSRGQGAEITR